ncbi:MAG: alpha/beta hydrolase [Clostridia bacterium]|nr:alpha/beta hydrolase [Clostridia bacterium]
MSEYLTVGGHKLRYICFGSGEDIVFLHGWGASASAFLFVAKRFCGDHRVTVIDFAGFGESEEPPIAYGVPEYTNDVLKLLEHIGINRAVFVGHSFGGRVCLELGAKHSEYVRKLVLVDSAGLKPRRGLKYYFKIGIHKFLRKLGLKGLGGSSDYKVLSPIMRESFKLVVNYDQTPLLKSISCPTAIFWGDKDKETPPYMAHRLNRGIADSEIFWLSGGHFSYADDPKKFVLILRAFIG